MPSIGLFELLCIALAAFFVVGPSRFPRAMRDVGKIYGHLKRQIHNAQVIITNVPSHYMATSTTDESADSATSSVNIKNVNE